MQEEKHNYQKVQICVDKTKRKGYYAALVREGNGCIVETIIFYIGKDRYPAQTIFDKSTVGKYSCVPERCVDYKVKFPERHSPQYDDVFCEILCNDLQDANGNTVEDCGGELQVKIRDALKESRGEDSLQVKQILPGEKFPLGSVSDWMFLTVYYKETDCFHEVRISFSGKGDVQKEPHILGSTDCWILACNVPDEPDASDEHDEKRGNFSKFFGRDGGDDTLHGVKLDGSRMLLFVEDECIPYIDLYDQLDEAEPHVSDLEYGLSFFQMATGVNKIIYYAGHGNMNGAWSIDKQELDVIESLESWLFDPVDPKPKDYNTRTLNKEVVVKLDNPSSVGSGFSVKPAKYSQPFLLPARTLIIISDSCFSGKIVDNLRNKLVYSREVSDFEGWSAIAVIAACHRFELAKEKTDTGGIFTQKLLWIWRQCKEIGIYKGVIGDQRQDCLQLQARFDGFWEEKDWLPTIEILPKGRYQPLQCSYEKIGYRGATILFVCYAEGDEQKIVKYNYDTFEVKSDAEVLYTTHDGKWTGKQMLFDNQKTDLRGFQVSNPTIDVHCIYFLGNTKSIAGWRMFTDAFYDEVLKGIAYTYSLDQKLVSFELAIWNCKVIMLMPPSQVVETDDETGFIMLQAFVDDLANTE